MLPPDAVVRRNDRVVFRELTDGEGGVLLHLDTGGYFGVNAVGSLAWTLIDGERTVSAVVDGVRARVAGAPEALDQEVTGFLQSLCERELLLR